MNDPQRLLAGDATEFEHMLLDGAAGEAPSKQLSALMLSAVTGAAAGTIALTVASTGTAAAGTNALPTAGVVAWKWVVSAVGVGALGSGLWLASTNAAAPAVSPPVEPPAEVSPPAAAAALIPALPPSTPKVVEEPSQGAAAQETTRRATPSPPPTRADPLRAELRVLDQARGALAREDSGQALSLLRGYKAQFPKGILRQEATVLRVRALEAQGRSREAAALKESFIQKHPDSAHNQRLERRR